MILCCKDFFFSIGIIKEGGDWESVLKDVEVFGWCVLMVGICCDVGRKVVSRKIK